MACHPFVSSEVETRSCVPRVPRLRSGRTEFSGSAARLAGLAGALLGWRPEEFWRATPEELAAILGALGGERTAGLGGADLARLQEMFPDG